MAISTRCLTDHHGPLIPPPAFQDAGAPLTGKALEDAVRELVTLLSDHWISVVTDGELARGGSSADPVAEVRRLAALTDGRVKVRVPRASATTMIEAHTLKSLLDAGCGYLQLDGAAYAPLLKKSARGAGKDAQIEVMLAADAAVLGQFNVEPDAVKIAVCFHDPADLSSRPFADDLDLDATARVLRGLKVNRFIFDCGSGTPDYGFLKLLPGDTQAALCLVDGNADQPEDADSVLQRILPATKVIDTDRLALGMRHGFYRRPGQDPHEAWARQSKVLTLLLDASSRAWGIDF